MEAKTSATLFGVGLNVAEYAFKPNKDYPKIIKSVGGKMEKNEIFRNFYNKVNITTN